MGFAVLEAGAGEVRVAGLAEKEESRVRGSAVVAFIPGVPRVEGWLRMGLVTDYGMCET